MCLNGFFQAKFDEILYTAEGKVTSLNAGEFFSVLLSKNFVIENGIFFFLLVKDVQFLILYHNLI